MKFPTWASQWYFFPNQKAQLQFEITMESNIICLFWANPTGATSDLVSLFSYIRGWQRFRFSSTVSCSNGLPFSFNPCIGGEGFPWSDPLRPLKSRADRRVQGSEFLTLHSLAAVLKRILRFKEFMSHHFPFSPKMLPFLPHSPLYKEKMEKGTNWPRYRKNANQQQSKQGCRNMCCCFWDMHPIKGRWKTFMESKNVVQRCQDFASSATSHYV